MARQRRNSRRKGCNRNRRQRGGDGMAYSINGTVTGQHVINNYDGAVNRFASCEDATRPGYLTGAAASIKGGLPGFAGGRRSASSFADLKGGSASGFKGGRRSASTMKGGRSASTMKGGRWWCWNDDASLQWVWRRTFCSSKSSQPGKFPSKCLDCPTSSSSCSNTNGWWCWWY